MDQIFVVRRQDRTRGYLSVPLIVGKAIGDVPLEGVSASSKMLDLVMEYHLEAVSCSSTTPRCMERGGASPQGGPPPLGLGEPTHLECLSCT